MDATNDLILGVFANVDMDWIDAYAVSSVRCGFRGRKILLVWNLHPTVRAKLIEYKFELIDVNPNDGSGDWHKSHKSFYAYRDQLAYEFLRDRGDEFRYVFWMDIRDLVFQTDPSVWLDKNLGDKKLVIATESYYIKNEQCNDNWIKNIFPQEYTRLREYEALNGGTFAGTPDVLADIFKRTIEIESKTNEIAEQAALNYIARLPEYESITLVPRLAEKFALVGYCFGNLPTTFWLDPNPELRQGVLYPKGSDEAFSIVHQYDRHRGWKFPVGDHYRTAPKPRPKYAADGLTIDWWG